MAPASSAASGCSAAARPPSRPFDDAAILYHAEDRNSIGPLACHSRPQSMAVPKVARLLALAHPSGPARTRPGGPMLRATGLAPMFVRAASSGAAIHRLVVRRLATGAAAKSSTPCAMAWRLRPLPLPLPASPPRALVRRTPGSAARAAPRSCHGADLVSCIRLFYGAFDNGDSFVRSRRSCMSNPRRTAAIPRM